MSVINNIVGAVARMFSPPSSSQSYFHWKYGGQKGVTANQDNVNGLASWTRGINILSGDIANVPKGVFQRTNEGIKSVNHPLNKVLNRNVNFGMTSITFHSLAMRFLMNYGNFIAIKQYSNGLATNFIPVHPDLVKVYVYYQTGQVVYEIMDTELGGKYERDQIFHIMGTSDNGFWGCNPIDEHRDTLSLTLNAQKSGQTAFTDGIIADKVLYKEGKYKSEDRDELENAMNKYNASGSKTVVLPSGFKLEELKTANLEALQYLETRKFQASDIALILGLPPSMLNGEQLKYDNLEGFRRQYVTQSLMPWINKFEREFSECLTERQLDMGYFVDYDERSLMRGDMEAQANYYTTMVGGGIMTIAEARNELSLPFIEDTDQVLIPANNLQPIKNLNNGDSNKDGND